MRYLLAIIYLISLNYKSQELQFNDIVSVDSTNAKDKIYNRLLNWTAANYNTKADKIIVNNMESGIISAVGIYNYRTDEKYKGKACVEGPVKYILNLYVKDGKYKYVFQSFEHKGSHGSVCRQVNYGITTTSEEAPAQGKGIQYNLGYADLKLKLKQFVENKLASIKKAVSDNDQGGDNW